MIAPNHECIVAPHLCFVRALFNLGLTLESLLVLLSLQPP